MKLVDLRPILAQLGLKTNGAKALLIDRLWSALLTEGFPARPAVKNRHAHDYYNCSCRKELLHVCRMLINGYG